MSEAQLTQADLAAYDFVEQMLPKADGAIGSAPWWHGWALREAFRAGVAFARIRRERATK